MLHMKYSILYTFALAASLYRESSTGRWVYAGGFFWSVLVCGSNGEFGRVDV